MNEQAELIFTKTGAAKLCFGGTVDADEYVSGLWSSFLVERNFTNLTNQNFENTMYFMSSFRSDFAFADERNLVISGGGRPVGVRVMCFENM